MKKGRYIAMNEMIEKIKNIMKEQDLNQKELAKKSGLAESTVSRYLSEDHVPGMKNFKRIAEALNVKPSYLLDDGDDGVDPYIAVHEAVIRYGNQLTSRERNALAGMILIGGKNDKR